MAYFSIQILGAVLILLTAGIAGIHALQRYRFAKYISEAYETEADFYFGQMAKNFERKI